MKKKFLHLHFPLLVLLIAMLASCSIAPENEMPVTTDSDEAREAFYLGREHYFLNEFDPAVKELKKAIKLDENFALAYLFLDLVLSKRQ